MITSEDSLSKQYSTMVDATNIVSKTDIHGKITYVNDKFIEISGFSREELLGNSHNIIRDPSLSASIFEDLWATLKSKKVWHGVITNLKKDGSKYTVNSSIFPIINEMGVIKEFIAIRHDITPLHKLNTEIQMLHNYNLSQEQLAIKKLKAGIVNDMSEKECQVLYSSSDVLSGDFYSIYKLNDGSTFLYVMDGQGHGISPALTVFAISSMLKQMIYGVTALEEIIEELASSVKSFLGEEEQLAYTMIKISSDKKSISYSSAGMYPFLIKTDNEIIKIKANNLLFMNFSALPKIETLSIENWNSLLVYSDGIVEHDNDDIKYLSPEYLITNSSEISTSIETISSKIFDDDVTLIHLNNT